VNLGATEMGAAQWAFEHEQAAGASTHTLPAATALYLPLKSARGAIGVVGVFANGHDDTLSLQRRQLAETFASQAALAIERAVLAEEARQAWERVEAEFLRNTLLSGVSHELRTPLAQIRMFSETLTLGRVRSDEERRRSLAIIDQEARRLTHLVENLLHFSRSERQIAHITPEPTALAPLVQEVIDGFAPLAAARGARLAASVPESLVVTADPGAVRQMLLNLLDNAVKYGPAGQEVRIGALQDNGVAKLWVDDAGPGIPRADRDRVWERFWRLERDRESAVAGSGIGLAVVRELATLHHGRAWIDEHGPEAGPGTRVVIELPV
jgi:K+-sensing histidine kinase KdpD